jgi:hypothetical protein
VQDYGVAAVSVGVVDDAWALDADGQPVDTEYRIEGDTLVQVISPDADTAFPVVADPRVVYSWWGFTVYYNKSETVTIASGSAACAALTVLIPDPTVTKVVAATCGLLAVWAADAASRGRCIKLVKYGYIGPGVPQQYSGGYCR